MDAVLGWIEPVVLLYCIVSGELILCHALIGLTLGHTPWSRYLTVLAPQTLYTSRVRR